MKAIMISIKPKWVEKILNGEKIIEIRKTCPKQLRGDTPIKPEPIDVYIYCTKDKKYANLINRGGFLTGMVVAKFTLNKVEEFYDFDDDLCKSACLDRGTMLDYLGTKNGYAWHISNLVIFDKPKDLNAFSSSLYWSDPFLNHGLTKAPQSWCYVEVLG